MEKKTAAKKMSECKDIVQSYGSTIMCYNYSTYQQRIMTKIAEFCQVAMRGENYAEHLNTPFCTDGVNINMAVAVSDIIGKSHNKEPLKACLLDMQKSWVVQYYDKVAKVWRAAPVIYNLAIEDRTGVVRFSCAKWLIDYICDFRQGGYRKYNVQAALGIRSAYQARLYQMTASLQRDIAYNISNLKAILGLGDKMKRNTDFIRRCIKPAAEMLEKKGLNGFTFELKKSEESKKKGCDIIVFHPVKRENKEPVSPMLPALYDERVKVLLMTNCKMSNKEISAHIGEINAFCALPNCVQKLCEIINRAAKKRKNKGYVFAAIRSVIQNTK